MFCNWNGLKTLLLILFLLLFLLLLLSLLREDSFYRPTLYVSQFKSKAVFDSDFQSVLDYGILVRGTNGSGFQSLVGMRIPWAECSGIQIFFRQGFPDCGFRRQKCQGFRNSDYLATPYEIVENWIHLFIQNVVFQNYMKSNRFQWFILRCREGGDVQGKIVCLPGRLRFVTWPWSYK